MLFVSHVNLNQQDKNKKNQDALACCTTYVIGGVCRSTLYLTKWIYTKSYGKIAKTVAGGNLVR